MFEFINSSRPVCGIEQRYAAQEMQGRIRRPDFDRIREVLRSAAMADGGGLAKQLL